MGDIIKVLVVDDTAIMRSAVTHILQSDPMIQVVGSAKDGAEGLKKIQSLKPDVVTLDIDMPIMNGLTAIRHIMIESPTPIVVLSSLIKEGFVIFEALRLGVVDFVPKPSTALSIDMDTAKQQIIDRVKFAKSMSLENVRRVQLQKKWDVNQRLEKLYKYYPLDYLVVIGTTLSGPNTIIRLLTRLSPTIPAAIIVQQEISPKILPSFVSHFNEYVPWKVETADSGKVIEQGTCYIASNEHSLSVELNDNGDAYLNSGDRIPYPLDFLFSSAATVFRQHTIGILLGGIGDDGSEGFAVIKKAAGTTMAKKGSCCVYPNLTEHAIRKGVVDMALDDPQFSDAIESVMKGENEKG